MNADQTQTLLELLQLLTTQVTEKPAPSQEMLMEALSKSISDFNYDPENGNTFDIWYSRYKDLFQFDCAKLDDAAKVRLLLRKLDNQEHDKYLNFILPSTPKDFNFDQTVMKLKTLFARKESIFHIRLNCFQMSKSESEDLITYASRVNRICEDFKYTDLKLNQFKSLIFATGLKSHEDQEIRMKILSKLDSDAEITIEKIVQDCQKLKTLKEDTILVEKPKDNTVNFVGKNKKFQSQFQSKFQSHSHSKKHEVQNQPQSKLPRTPCWNCGDLHFSKYCEFKNHQCKDCNKIGHKEGYCVCFRSSSKSTTNQNEDTSRINVSTIFKVHNVSSQSKRKYVNVKFNNTSVSLQLDSGSDITIISKATWKRIGKPKLKVSEVVATDASKNTIKFDGEFDCQLQFNNNTQAGKCFVTDSNLNLLGIDFMEKFKFFSIPISQICNSNNSHKKFDNSTNNQNSKPQKIHSKVQKNLHNGYHQQNHSYHSKSQKFNFTKFSKGEKVTVKHFFKNQYSIYQATVIEKVDPQTYNVLLDKCKILIRAQPHQMRKIEDSKTSFHQS